MPALSVAPDAPQQPDLGALAARQPAIDFQYDPKLASRALVSRQSLIQPGIIPTYYNFDGPTPGTVVGIVLGSVAGFLLLVWLIFSLTQVNSANGTTNTIRGEEEIVVRRRRGSRGSRGSQGASNRSRRSTRTEGREYSRSPARQVIVEERRRTTTRPRSIVVEDRRVPGDDVVEVIEEHDDYPPRRGPRRSGGYR